MKASLSLPLLQDEIRACQACSLRAGCHNPVPPGPSEHASFMLVGESPDSEAELFGEPYAGREGKLLLKMLNEAEIMAYECHITYLVKCRGKAKKANRVACFDWFQQEVELVEPLVIVGLGLLPSRTILCAEASASMQSLAGKHHFDNREAVTRAAWHSPSYIMNHGKKAMNETVNFFRLLRETYVD